MLQADNERLNQLTSDTIEPDSMHDTTTEEFLQAQDDLLLRILRLTQRYQDLQQHQLSSSLQKVLILYYNQPWILK